jgi:hypothetical protein
MYHLIAAILRVMEALYLQEVSSASIGFHLSSGSKQEKGELKAKKISGGTEAFCVHSLFSTRRRPAIQTNPFASTPPPHHWGIKTTNPNNTPKKPPH